MNYGIRNENEGLVIGDLPVKVEDNKIIIGDKEYVSTPQLWALIMQKSPDMMKIDDDTVQEYKRLITDAGVEQWVEENYKGLCERLRKTKILAKEGEGITFLPSDIKSLQTPLETIIEQMIRITRLLLM